MKMKIGILGAESTGKSTLAEQLAKHFSGCYVPEYARWYVEQLGRAYTYADVELIALRQIEQLAATYNSDYVFFDTELIVTKVWFQDKYGCLPQWFEQALRTYRIDFCLLTMPDLNFEPDPVRENGHRREQLTDWYKSELEGYNIPFAAIAGIGADRLASAISAIDNFHVKY